MVKYKQQQIFVRRIQEQQSYKELQAKRRKEKDELLMKKAAEMVGPAWYQVLSPNQRTALDNLTIAIKQDVLEDRANRSQKVIVELGVYPSPTKNELMECIYFGRKKPIHFIAEVFRLLYDHPVNIRREAEYSINARLLMSAICYLGLDELIKLLTERLHVEPEEQLPPTKPEKKKKAPVSFSPYSKPQIYVPPKPKAPAPKKVVMPPMPSFTELDLVPYEEETLQENPPPAPPTTSLPPPIRLEPPNVLRSTPVSKCDEIAGIANYLNTDKEQRISTDKIEEKRTSVSKVSKRKDSRLRTSTRTFGITAGGPKKTTTKSKPSLNPLPFPNVQYINGGVAIVNGKSVFIINGVHIATPEYNMINNGVVMVEGQPFYNIGGYFKTNEVPFPKECDCVKRYKEKITAYLEKSKCRCGHHYDFYNEGALKPNEHIYFTPARRGQPHYWDYAKIFDLDQKRLHADSVIEDLIYNDSVIGLSPDTEIPTSKNKRKASSKGCSEESPYLKYPGKYISTLRLSGGNSGKVVRIQNRKKKKQNNSDNSEATPKPTEYLKRILAPLRPLSVLASLPESYLVPELVEWMRYRMQGPITQAQRAKYMMRSKVYWEFYKSLARKRWGHVPVPKMDFNEKISKITWRHKNTLKKKFSSLRIKHKRDFFISAAKRNNMLWATMFQDVIPDNKFRRVFFAYIGSRQENYHIIRPYNSGEAWQRREMMRKRRMSCIEKFTSQKMD